MTSLLAAIPAVRVLVVTTFRRPGLLRRALEVGASGFVVKDTLALHRRRRREAVHLSEGTVRNHLSSATGKTGARTRPGAQVGENAGRLLG